MEFVSIVKLDDGIKGMLKSCEKKALVWLNDKGVDSGSKVAWLDESGKTIIGDVYVENQFEAPAVWLKDESQKKTPLCEVDFIVLLKEIKQSDLLDAIMVG